MSVANVRTVNSGIRLILCTVGHAVVYMSACPWYYVVVLCVIVMGRLVSWGGGMAGVHRCVGPGERSMVLRTVLNLL